MRGYCDSDGCPAPSSMRCLCCQQEFCDGHAKGHPPKPVPMIMYCPVCFKRHIDVDEFATKPHHTHACQYCGFVWRPAIELTVGVRFLPGFKDGGE